MNSVVLLRWWLALTVAACSEEAWKTAEAFTVDDCNDPGCPTNSPVIATYPIFDLSIGGEMNLQDFWIEKFIHRGNPAEFRVEDGRIRARRNGILIAEGINLKGDQLWLRHENDRYILMIADVVKVKMWATLPGKARPSIEVYKLTWVRDLGVEVPPPHSPQWTNICHDAMLPANSIELDLPKPPDGSRHSNAQSAASAAAPPNETYIPNDVTFVFEGDRINAAAKKVYDIDKKWFNLGCAGHLLSKMHLMGHVAATASLGYITTLEERTAIMKMFAADYCGTGRPFTVPGVQLQWHDHREWLDYFPTPVPVTYDVEARWTARGAACLSVPRAEAHPTDDSRAEFPSGVRAAIASECRMPPACTNQDPEDFAAGAHMITVNP